MRLLRDLFLFSKTGLTVATSRFYQSHVCLCNWLPGLRQPQTAADRTNRQALTHVYWRWPILTFCLTFLLAYGLTWSSGPLVAFQGALFAALMGLAGSLVCGPLFHILGVGAGGALFGVMFGITQSLLSARIGTQRPDLHGTGMVLIAQLANGDDPFTATVLGAVGLSAPYISGPMLTIYLALPWIAIVGSAWLMGIPKSVDSRSTPPGNGRLLLAVTIGFCGGAGIGAIKGIYTGLSLLTPNAGGRFFAFWATAAVVAGACYALCVRLRTKSLGQGFIWAAAYVVVWATLGVLIWQSRGQAISTLFQELATAFFHAAFFTLSYAIGFVMAGRRAAFFAAAAEGSLFVLFNVLHFFKVL